MRHCIVLFLLLILNIHSCKEQQVEPIDRFDLVNRHNVVITTIDSLNSLTVGNGDFAFTVDITGMQTFPAYYVKGIPLGTFSNWCWHSEPNATGFAPSQTLKYFEVGDREVGYYHDYGREKDTERALASSFLRENPHRMNMGMLGLKILKENGEPMMKEDIINPNQVLDLWNGMLTSRFEIEGKSVQVKTLCHPDQDIIAFSIESELIQTGRLSLELRFPEADNGWKNVKLFGNDSNHKSILVSLNNSSALLLHKQDSTEYMASLQYDQASISNTGQHTFELRPEVDKTGFTCSLTFEQGRKTSVDRFAFEEIQSKASDSWQSFWQSGGAVDLSGSSDPRSTELERRIILSQYLSRVQCSGYLPPQETGLTYNSWFGKFHLEMHWWHGVHFALWQREEILEKQMQYYKDIRDEARELAQMQGYAGVRWPKMVGPDGITSPSTVGNYLIWQQPHYIYFAELLYAHSRNRDSLLLELSPLVFETAAFMASYPVYEAERERYNLGPALIPAQETFSAETTINPSFELAYWHWALLVAIEWKERLNEKVPEKWKTVLENLAELPVSNGLYLFTEDGTDSYTNERYISDHPMVLGCLGMLPETGLVDREIMLNTFREVVKRWNWERTWGWDYPLVAMTAAELGLAEEAIEYLMYDVKKNTYLPNGHNYQDDRLTLYLPGNGALLTAVARMCTKDQFPDDGTWKVRWENLNDF